MKIQVIEQSDDLTHVALVGSLDVDGANRINLEFTTMTAGRGKPTIVDFSEVTYLASMGIRLLFSCAKPLAKEGAKMVILNPHELVEQILTSGGVTPVVPVAHGMDEAKQLLGIA